jgi:uncharacterized protein YggE
MRTACVIIAILLASSSFAQTPDLKPNQFTVQGSIELKLPADQASFYFSMKGVGSTLREAVGNAEKKTRVLVTQLIGLGVKENGIATSDFYSGENYGDKAFLSSNRDFRAIITTVVTIDSLKSLSPIIFAVSEAEPENMSQISFTLKDELPFRRRARVEAGLKAREKADDIGKALGVSIGRVLSIEELSTLVTNPGQSLRGGRASLSQFNTAPNPFNPSSIGATQKQESIDESQGSGFFAQTISVTSQVRVIFEIK